MNIKEQQLYCVVTGANAGIGLAATLELARRGVHVVGVCRNLAGANALLKRAVEDGVGERVVAEITDLARLSQVRALALRLRRRLHRLDILINNAGLISPVPELSADGVELTFAVNHLSHFLLSRELLPLLKVKGGRVINVVDDSHRDSILPLHACESVDGYDWSLAYNRAMFAKTATSLEAARRLAADGIAVHTVHPGTVKTGLFRHLGALERGKLQFTGVPPKNAATPIVRLALDSQYAQPGLAYFKRNARGDPAALATHPEVVDKLWKMSEQLCQRAAATRQRAVGA